MQDNKYPSTDNIKASLDKQAELFYDHYKESINTLSSLVGKRMRIVILIFITLAMMVFQGTDPESANSFASQFINQAAGGKDLATKLNMDPRFISSLMWFLLATLTVQAYGCSLLIRLQSNYLNRVEADLDKCFDRPLISCRRTKRPRYFSRADFLYVQVFMVLLGVVVLGKICLEVQEIPGGDIRTIIFTLVDLILALAIFYYTFEFRKGFRSLGNNSDVASAP